MGSKNVCLDCRRVESLGMDVADLQAGDLHLGDCPECSAPMYLVSQKFRPPKKTDDKAWRVAAFLISNGFTYHTIRDSSGMAVSYPTTMSDAERFVDVLRTHAAERKTRRRHELEKQIAELESRSPNEQRAILIREIRQELSNHSS